MTTIGRGGHRPDCQCAICKSIRRKAEREVQVAVAPPVAEVAKPVLTVGSLQIGELFRYRANLLEPLSVYKKLADVPHLRVTNAMIIGTIGDETIQLPLDTQVEKMPPAIPVRAADEEM